MTETIFISVTLLSVNSPTTSFYSMFCDSQLHPRHGLELETRGCSATVAKLILNIKRNIVMMVEATLFKSLSPTGKARLATFSYLAFF